MDSFFKAAVCDLDKLLDDFELNSDELECRPAFLKAPPYPFSSLGSSSKPPAFLQGLPDLSSIHYGSASSCLDGHGAQISGSQDCEVGGRPLTGVDLLSSVDRGTTKSSAPPCPDRALKPVCDLVNDTSSAMLVRTNSHDAFRELEAAEMQQQQQEDEEVLLVDFTSPVVTEHRGAGPCGGEEGQSCSDMLLKLSGGFSASLSLLDVILPAAADRGSELSEESPSTTDSAPGAQAQGSASSDQELQISVDSQESDHDDDTRETSSDKQDHDAKVASPPDLRGGASDGGALGLSSPRLAAFRAPTGSRTSEDGCEEEAPEEEDVCESTEADSLMVSNALEERADADRNAEVRLSPEGQQVCTEPAAAAPPTDLSPDRSETSPLDPPEFGFEYLPESDQAELLVTDEELDAFLKAHAEAEQGAGVSYCSEPESHPGLGGRLEDQELRMCGQERQEDVEGRASPESDQVCVSADGGSDQAAPPGSANSCMPRQERSSGGNRSLTSPDQQTSYGGARPKLTHHLTVRPPPAGEDEEERVQAPSPPAGSAENEDSSITSPVEEHPSPPYPSQEHQEYSVGYEELSEPPPYPGEPLADAMGSTNCRRDTGEELGCRQPAWVPDADAPNCMNCNQKFTFTRRRHHCRACGRVYCTLCCSRKCKLKYLDKEARVCVICFHIINTGQALERMMSPTGPSPNPNIPSEYCSTIPPLQQARAAGTLNSPPPTVMVPVSVLKQPNHDGFPREQKRVWFADGILPNGEVADTTRLSVTQRRSSQEFMPDETAPVSEVSSPAEPEATGSGDLVRPPLSGPWDYALLSVIGSLVRRVPSLLPDNEDQLPPLLIITGEDDEEGGGLTASRLSAETQKSFSQALDRRTRGSPVVDRRTRGSPVVDWRSFDPPPPVLCSDVLVEDSPAPCQILHLLEEGGPRPLTFVLNPNLLVNVKLVPYGSRRCWCFGSNGLQALGQRELVFLLECLPEEKALPRDVFSLYLGVYQDAQKGKFVEELDNLTFTSSFLGSKDHAGMLFSAVSCQPLDGLMLPLQPFLFGLLIHKLEVPWAKVFPLRLLLRLGAQYNVYPTPLVSVRFRDSLYRETGHTIMNLLADLRNYQYSLPVVKGLRIHMEVGHIYIDIPKSSFNEIQKVLNASNEHVISIGATFSPEADSHLVCFQNEEGGYQTQAHTMTGKTRTVTGASFVVFNGSLKASSGFIAKSSIVEDGLMVQIPPETMESLRSALRDQTDFHIPCGKNDDGEVRENVTIRWVDRTAAVNTGKSSGVDGRALNGVHSVRLQQDAEFELDGRSIRCTEVFYHLKAPDCSLAAVLSSCSAFQKEIAMATCSTLTPHLAVLSSSGINSFSLRISTQADMVEYQAGSGGKLLPQRYMNEMDSALIPVIHGGGASVPQTAMDMEFIFFVMHAI